MHLMGDPGPGGNSPSTKVTTSEVQCWQMWQNLALPSLVVDLIISCKLSTFQTRSFRPLSLKGFNLSFLKIKLGFDWQKPIFGKRARGRE